VSQEKRETADVSVDRLLTFSDGVFAIAVTLLVLDLHLPIVAHGLLHAVLRQWPEYLSYTLSFLVISIIWAQHHWMFRYIRRTDHLFLLINLIFLMWVAVTPFPTALLARYLESPAERQTAIAIYTGVFAFGGVLVNLKWLYAIHSDRLLGDEVDRLAIKRMTRRYPAGPILYLVAFALVFVSPPASIALICLINLFYALSPLLDRSVR
jgi:uncharacterized membrane protein